MASRLNPYLNFPGTARQALTFYHEVLGGDLIMNTYGEFGADNEPFAANIMHGQLETPQGYTLMAADIPPGTELQDGNNITVCLSGDDDELRVTFERLSNGGTVQVPLAKQMWGDEYGQFTDKFGIQWMLNLTQQQQQP